MESDGLHYYTNYKLYVSIKTKMKVMQEAWEHTANTN